jgi:HSP20 family protein
MMTTRRFDPFRELDRMLGDWPVATPAPSAPMDAVRTADELVLSFDLPGVDPASVDLTVERNVLTLAVERTWEVPEGSETLVRERRHGRIRRQVQLADSLDGGRVSAAYDRGVLTVRVPVAEQAQPRRVQIALRDGTVEADALPQGDPGAD